MTDVTVVNLTTKLANALARVIAGRPLAESQAEWEDAAATRPV
ncbi:MAG: hypothetical protein N2688_00090 [Burkholderiaceae bacterium]|nr:hypothetical protein [Burkholderiaceae bacterium]